MTCCTPAAGSGDDFAAPAIEVRGRHRAPQATIPAGSFVMGDHTGDGFAPDGELPLHEVSMSAFTMDAHAVTTAAFAEFVAATGYRTVAEQQGFSAVFHLLVADPGDVIEPYPDAHWWFAVSGADWQHPFGRASTADGVGDHPAVHISWIDAQAYCDWSGRALPTEAQWEYAARGGLSGARYPWGDELTAADGTWLCNIWQGEFPAHNTADDGYVGTAPVRSYAPNGHGLWQMAGNVWEWCADRFDPRYYRASERHDPRGPVRGRARVLRGGSYLCHDSYCNRYRNSARSHNTPVSSMGNAGFRTVGISEDGRGQAADT
ncbi:formylglycine-generating enzyme family protein [Williamsia sp.]|uniref:formylglycine-generating enzyme family protein n=1 Tax=Williamsia sp. TaxID=1872085 RepID=UPI002F95C86F